jgi:hypothetical protein
VILQMLKKGDWQTEPSLSRIKTKTYTGTRLIVIQRLSIVLWGYCVGVWLYVIAMQLRYPNSVYWPLAVWVPIRLDYLGEAAFALSFVLAVIAASASTAKRRIDDFLWKKQASFLDAPT